ncbi:hypothetical protein G4B88_008952 [Cannabis sativa]|uniref:Uncharacterized protein n=1 Tax=Cannabis sativa TaxID=3483 RepID=A0A7J6HPA9_CANSA|nr:hypothetical protein G4B88_008952 [Cannabis sativa]
MSNKSSINTTKLDILAQVCIQELNKIRHHKQPNDMVENYVNTNSEERTGIIKGPDPPPPLSQAFLEKIRIMQGIDDATINDNNEEKPFLIYQKGLFAADISLHLNRLSMPLKQIKSVDFLSLKEKAMISKKNIEIRVIGPNLEEETLLLTRWKCAAVGQIVQIWFFRDINRNPCFAIVNLGFI